MAELRLGEMEWTSRTPRPGETLVLDGVKVRVREPGGAVLISGNLDAAIRRYAKGAARIGLFEPEGSGVNAIRIARDRALLVTDKPLDMRAGWDKGGYTLTPADDLHAIFAVTGQAAGDLMASMMNMPAGTVSPSAAVMVAGLPALVTGLPDGYCIRIERSQAAGLWHFLKGLREVPLR